jgi:small subunit ribosomal protein S9
MHRLVSSTCRKFVSSTSCRQSSNNLGVTLRSSTSGSGKSNKLPTTTLAIDPSPCTTLHRFFSTLTLKRPPERIEEPNPKRNWRTHAVSLEFGDYGDDDEYYNNSNVHGGGVVQQYTPSSSSNSAITESSSASSVPSWQDEEWELAKQVQELQDQEDAKRKRWLESTKPPLRVPVIDERGRAYGRGGRKTASARVWIEPGFGNIVVNKRDFIDYFGRTSDREHVLGPFTATDTCGKFDVMATVMGGGLTGQAGAIRHGVARALNHYNPDEYRPALKRLGYLTRDPRKVERKKVGHLKARKKPQWVKR